MAQSPGSPFPNYVDAQPLLNNSFFAGEMQITISTQPVRVCESLGKTSGCLAPGSKQLNKDLLLFRKENFTHRGPAASENAVQWQKCTRTGKLGTELSLWHSRGSNLRQPGEEAVPLASGLPAAHPKVDREEEFPTCNRKTDREHTSWGPAGFPPKAPLGGAHPVWVPEMPVPSPGAWHSPADPAALGQSQDCQ